MAQNYDYRTWGFIDHANTFSGGANAVKEPGHFEVRESSSQVNQIHFFLKKS